MNQLNIRSCYPAFIVFFLMVNITHAQNDIADVPSQKHVLKNKLVFHVIGDESKQAPENGYKLLVVLTGGDGSKEFIPFVKRIYKNCLDEDYLVIQLIARKWTTKQYITWPTEDFKVKRMKASTEEFIAQAINDVKKRTKIDSRHVTALGWSSGGCSLYGIALKEKSPITGSFIAMSVFKPEYLPPLTNAKGRNFYIFHSKEDRVCPYRMAASANKRLKKNGANVNFVTYQGGHGWRGNVYGNIREGINWLEEQNEINEKTE